MQNQVNRQVVVVDGASFEQNKLSETVAFFGPDGEPYEFGSGGLQFKKTIFSPSAPVSTTSTSFVDIDAGLPALSLELAIGDVVECELKANVLNDLDAYVVAFDWVIDRPVSANTNFRTITGMAYGDYIVQRGNGYGILSTMSGYFTATEAGLHTFKPQWLVSGGTGRLHQTAYPHTAPIKHIITNLGPETA